MSITEKHWKQEFEQSLHEAWKANKKFAFVQSGKPVYSIDTPPPYVNAPIHMGHATTYVLMDMFARYKRMTGHDVIFPLGLDRNGLPIEMAAEKKFKVKFTEIDREKALEYCRKILEETSMESVSAFQRAGISFTSWEFGTAIGDAYMTDSEQYRILTQNTFIDLWNKGLVYEDARINNWCPGCQTTIADSEIDYADMDSAWHKITFKVKETGEELIIGTTRPELVCTCGMVIFHPDDERYKHLEGKTAVTPLFEKEIPIKAHPQADMEKGTGVVMMCSAGDLSDIRFFREQELQPVIAINKDGSMNEHAGFLQGMSVKEARKTMADKLDEASLLVEKKHMQHRTPICERSKDPIEFIEMTELYVKQTHVIDDIRKHAAQLNFFDDSSRQILLSWLENVSMDWPISRRRYYATEIPLWWCDNCEKGVVPPKGNYYQPWKQESPVACGCGNKELRGETRVFDTWFDSSNTPLYVLQYGTDFYEQNKPCTLRPQGKEIIRTWLYYTLLKAHLLTEECAFKDVWINYHILDGKGEKMSKSKGNVINPIEILDKFGAEPFRLWCAVEGNLTQGDLSCSFERIEGASKTLSKLWNVARFVNLFPKPEVDVVIKTPLDQWVLTELNRIVELARDSFEKYDFHKPMLEIKHFLWETFASHYIELVKNRAYNKDNQFSDEEQGSALTTLHAVLDTLLKLLAPVLPFITEKLYHDLRDKDIHAESFPECIAVDPSEISRDAVVEVNSAIWKAKKDAGLSLKSPVKQATIPEELKPLEQDIKSAHGIEQLEYGEFNLVLQ